MAFGQRVYDGFGHSDRDVSRYQSRTNSLGRNTWVTRALVSGGENYARRFPISAVR